MAERLRIGYLSGSRTVGGTERYLRELAWSIDRRGHEPVVLRRPTLARFFAEGRGAAIAQADLSAWEPGGRMSSGRPSARGTTPADRPLLGLRPAFVPVVKQLATAVDVPLVAKVLARQDLDLLHVHNGGHPGSPIALAAVLAAANIGIPTVLTVHGLAKPRGLLRRAEEELDRRLASAVAAVTTVGDAPAGALARLRGFDRTSIRVIATGIGLPATPTTRQEARAALGVAEDVPVIGSIAGFIPVKGHLAMLDILAHVRADVPDVIAVLAGDGPCRSQVIDRAEALGLADAVRLPGSVDPFSTLPAFDVFLSASTTEGLPLAILEAMSQGVPVVATGVGAVPEAVVHGETGFVVAPGDVDGPAGRLGQLLEDPALARRMGDAGRRRFDAHHRIEHMAAAFHGLYHEVLLQPQWR